MPSPRHDGQAGPGAVSSSGGVTDVDGVVRAEWQHFLDFYRPIEDEMLQKAMQTDFTKEGDVAGATASSAVNASAGTAARNISRAGGSLTKEESAALARRKDMTLAKAVGRAENTTRRAESDSRTNLLQGISSIGRGVANSASQGFNSVANMGAARENQYQQQSAQASATNMNSAATIASLAIMFI